MSDEFRPGSVGVEIASAEPAEMASGPSESTGYYGWRVVLARVRRDGGIWLRSASTPFPFCKGPWLRIRLES